MGFLYRPPSENGLSPSRYFAREWGKIQGNFYAYDRRQYRRLARGARLTTGEDLSAIQTVGIKGYDGFAVALVATPT